MLKKAKSTVSVILTVMMIVSCFAFADFSASAQESRTVYFKNNVGWEEVYCFIWGRGANKVSWPGDKMEYEGNDVWSYSTNSSSNNIIFNNGSSGAGNQTDDLVIPANGHIYDGTSGEWSYYSTEVPPEITSNRISGSEFKENLSLTVSAYAAETSYYTINGGEPVEFKDIADVAINDASDSEKEYTISVHSENAYGSSDETFVYYKVLTVTNTVESTAVPEFAEPDCLYAHAEAGSANTQAWQCWENQNGANAKSGIFYFFLPPTASDSEVELYNTFGNSVIINGVEILPNTSAIVSYTTGKTVIASVESSNAASFVQFYKSDSEVSLYINDTTGVYTDSNGNTVNTDFYSFLSADKENSVSGSDCTIIDDSGINDTVLKKIKGRGNTTWRTSAKKPFNINFDSKTSIGGITSKKFSLLSNSKDGTLLRNRIMYDLADEVGSRYSPASRNVDLYVNGSYKGAYQITQKVELGKNSLVSLKDESDELTENFNFLIEVDIWNYAGDTYFESDRGLHIVCKSPDLDGYDGVDEMLNAQYAYIKGKYQQLEDALYSGDMTELEKICDVESLARAYLLQEFDKNCDGGMTSCYFTYVADDGKFIADPIWDCDSALGNVYCERQNATNTAYTSGWAIKTAQYDKTEMTNIMGQAFNLEGTTSNNETFEDIVKRLWNDDFVPAISVLKGEATASGTRLQSVESYRNISPNSAYINYIMWKYEWFPYYESFGRSYTSDLEGQINYMYDWLKAREKWMNKTINNIVDIPDIPEDDYYLTGVGFGGWGAMDYKLEKTVEGYYSIDVTLTQGTEYSFKIFNGEQNYYTADISDETTAKYISLDGAHQNAAITPDEDMSVRFIFNGSSFVMELLDDDYPLGDVDLSGVVGIDDATLIQKHMASLVTLTDKQLELADMNGDGEVNIDDVTEIQKYLAGLI